MKNAGVNKQDKRTQSQSFFGRYLPELIVLCFAFLLYANSIPNNYNLDDELVTRNHKLTAQGISVIPEIFSSPYYTDKAGYNYEYRPVVLSSFAIEHQFFGDNPYVSHFFNLLLYALCCVILYRVLLKIIPGSGQMLSVCITLLFIANPTHTEVVSSIKNRDEILSLLFGLLSVYMAIKYVKGKKWYALSVPAFFLLALLSKSTVISFVIIIPIILIFFTEAGFKEIILITLLLLVPGIYAIDISFWNKLIGSFFIMAIVSAFYTLANFNTTFFQQRLNGIKSWFATDHASADSSYPGSFNPMAAIKSIKELFIGINPGPELFTFKPAAIAIATGALYFTGVVTVFNPLVVVAAIIFAVLILRGNEPVWWWASTIFFICLAFAPIKYAWNFTMYEQLVSTILIYHILFGNRKLFIPATIIYIVYAVIGWHFDAIYLIPNRLLGVVLIRFIGWPGILFQGFMLHSITKHIEVFDLPHIYRELNGIGSTSLIITALMLSLIFKKGTRYIMAGVVVLTLVIALSFQNQNSPAGMVEVQNKLSSAVNKVNPKFIDIKQQRPLDYIEQPVTRDSALTLRLGTAFEVMTHYFSKTIWPYPMAFYYGYRTIKPEHITEIIPLMGLTVFLVLAVLLFVLFRKNKLLGLGIFIYLTSLAVVSGYFYPVPGLVGERFMFIPTLGWSIVVGAGILTLFGINSNLSIKQWPTVATVPKVVFLLFLTLYSGLTFTRNFDWKDDLTLFRHDISYVNESAQANNLLSIHLIQHSLNISDPVQQKALREEAVTHLKKTVEISPLFFNANYDLGRMYMGLNMPDSALVWFLNAYKIKPAFIETTFSIADIYLQRHQYQPAIPYLEYAIKNKPIDYRGYSDLSYIYFQLHDFNKSIEVNRQAIASVSSNASPYVNIGNVYLNLNKPDSAALWARKALDIEPSNQLANQILQQVGARR